jgi:hypothetical protein
MELSIPATLVPAVEQLATLLKLPDGTPLDLFAAPWSDVEKGIIPLLGGAFSPERPEHQAVALGLAGAFGARLIVAHKAFWFLNRESAEGASVGFPEALVVLSPLGAVSDALGAGQLARLEAVDADIRRALGQARFGGGAPTRLEPADYERLFDPGFLQFVAMDGAKLKTAWEGTVSHVARELQDALSRSTKLPADARKQLEGQLLGTLQRLEGDKPMVEQAARVPRVGEVVGLLFAGVGGGGAAPEELWRDVAFPLLHVGVPTQFPPLDEEELKAAKEGVDPLFLFLEVVPYRHPALDEGLLETFAQEDLSLPHPKLQGVGMPHLIQLKPERLVALLEAFEPEKLKDAIERFAAHVTQLTGKPVARTEAGTAMLGSALGLLSELKALCAQLKGVSDGRLCLRRLTEAEAASEPMMQLVRTALSAPRIILA